MQKKKLNDHQFDVDYDPNRPISFPNDCHLGSQSVLTWPVVKKIAGDGQDTQCATDQILFTDVCMTIVCIT